MTLLFVVDKPRLQRIIAIVRDDRTPDARTGCGTYLRMEVADGCLKLTGLTAEAEIPATVYEPGVLFLKVTTFRQALRMLRLDVMGTRFITIQVGPDGLMFEGMRLPLNENDMLLYPDPAIAPVRHPAEDKAGQSTEGKQGELFS
jgi:hypothetical protein